MRIGFFYEVINRHIIIKVLMVLSKVIKLFSNMPLFRLLFTNIESASS